MILHCKVEWIEMEYDWMDLDKEFVKAGEFA